ncbi:MAG: flagellar biosynthesis protein FlhF [Lachnospiraceae bacterium]|nr:flagellar biosynthesis protein FlhF [Lachnospiraceae bacterium]
MIIKKFTAKTEAEATAEAKRELGPNVVVMNVRSVKQKGFFYFLKSPLMEVTVALEEEGEPGATRRRVNTPVPAPSQDPVREAISQVSTLVNADIEKEKKQAEDNHESVIEEKLDSLQSLLEKQIQTPAQSSAETETAKAATKTAQNKESDVEDVDAELLKFMKLLYNTMIDNEVNEKVANSIIDETRKAAKPGMPFDYALAATYQRMILKFGTPQAITPASRGPKVVFFIGPTGVGKTTTIAKIASKFSVDEGKKVALLTADTYRIAAAEQLRTYANILEVPFRIIYSVEEVENALEDFMAYDYILVDTAGHSHQNEAQRDQMNEFIHSVDGLAEKETFLVLSATTKYRDLISIADTYSAMTDYKLIFTKLDETTTLGNLLNLKLHTETTISYVTNGQNVPDDIAPFNPQKTVKLLLGGK